ncbi:thioesterase family protein [Rhizobacter sp. J219]|uniref:acyl-CoA thioesterase n=1 Tax=Rhizobacter sp. J219 TaxID=2898430 RepID=UPI0021510A24|nr:thioesterase family protein [Rhizobacter sp. J219]MCR5883137.1 thioesterase family protein [Rhizobacter sp. J219]
MSSLTPLSTLLAGRRRQAHDVSFDIPADWLQGRTSFGGLISTLAVQAMRDVAGRDWPATVKLRALQTSFIGPVGLGAMEVSVTLLREGKNIRQVQALVKQHGQVSALLLGVFGIDRDTIVPARSPERPPVAHAPDETPERSVRGGAPHFTQHMDMRFVEGAPPFSGQHSELSKIHLRLKAEPVPIDLELLTVLLADVPPAPVLSNFTQPTPASSVSWELELRPLAQAPAVDGWWRVDTDVLASGGGYVNQVTRLWAPGGELAALGYQVVAVYG